MGEMAEKRRKWYPEIDFARFFILAKMLLGNAIGISFRTDKKKAIIKIVSWVVGFAAVGALSFVFFFFANLLRIFSNFFTIPASAPSFICMVLFVVGLIPSGKKMVDRLYWSRDNRIILAMPCNASTIFASKLFVLYIEEILKCYMVEVPFLVGFLIFRMAPFYSYLWVFVAWAVLALAKTLFLAAISIPIHYGYSLFKKHSHIGVAVAGVLLVGIIVLTGWAISLLPDSINIADVWSEVNAAIMSFLRWYQNTFSVLYKLTNFTIGTFMEDGASYSFFTRDSVFVALGLVGFIVLFGYATLTFVGRAFFKMVSISSAISSSPRKIQGNLRSHRPLLSQLKKESLLFFADPMVFASTLGSFVFLPIFIALMNKIFGAFQTTSFGDGLVNAFNVLLILVIALATNTVLARIYSREGDAFALTRSYPRSQTSLLSSKIALPSFMGCISIVASVIVYSLLKEMGPIACIGLSIALVSIYLGHALFSAGLDFSTKSDQFADQDATSPSEVRSVVIGLLIAALAAFLFYLYSFDLRVWGSLTVHESAAMKMMIIGLLFLVVNVALYRLKIRYIYMKGRSL